MVDLEVGDEKVKQVGVVVGDEEVQQVGVVVGEERWIADQFGAASWWIGRHRQSPGTLFSLSLSPSIWFFYWFPLIPLFDLVVGE